MYSQVNKAYYYLDKAFNFEHINLATEIFKVIKQYLLLHFSNGVGIKRWPMKYKKIQTERKYLLW